MPANTCWEHRGLRLLLSSVAPQKEGLEGGDSEAYLAHVFAKSLTIGCAEDFKLDVGIRAILPKLHHSCESSDVTLRERRKDH